MSRLNDEMYAPGTLKFDESYVPSVPMKAPVYPRALSCWKNSCAFDATCDPKNTTFTRCATALLASDVKSVWVAGWDCRSTSTLAARSSAAARLASGTEYASAWSTTITVSPDPTLTSDA